MLVGRQTGPDCSLIINLQGNIEPVTRLSSRWKKHLSGIWRRYFLFLSWQAFFFPLALLKEIEPNLADELLAFRDLKG